MRHLFWAACGAAFLTASAVPATEIGAVAAVNRDVQGARPSEDPRRLLLSEKLIQNERITTSAESGGQVMFLDQTTLTLTPNSDIILDKYVFDPAADKGELAVTMLKGAMRMVGGRITKSSAATIRTPSATIGIRGGIGNITVKDDGSTEYMHIAGFSATITSNSDEKITITREGGMAAVSPPAGGVDNFVSQATGSQGGGAETPTTSVGRQTDGETSSGGGSQTGGTTSDGSGGTQTTSTDGETAGGDGSGAGSTAGASTEGGSGSGGATSGSEPSETASSEAAGTDNDNSSTGGSSGGVASDGGSTVASSSDGGASGGGSSTGGSSNGGSSNGGGGGKITYLGVATPEQVRATMSKRAGQGGGGSSVGGSEDRIQTGVQTVEQQISARPNAVTNAPISTTGERQEDDFAQIPVNLDDRPIEEFTDNEVAMTTEAEAAAQQVAQELNAVSFNGVWSATAGLTTGGFAPTEDNLAFRMRYSLLDQEGFVTVELPGGQDGAALTTFDGAAVTGDRFLIVGDDARNIVADTERLTLLGGDADGTALIIGTGDIANGSIFLDYEDVGLSQLQFVDGQVVGLTGQRLPTADIRNDVTTLRQTLSEPGN